MADQNLNQQVELIFARYDKDNSNTIEISELREYFKDIGMRLSFKELAMLSNASILTATAGPTDRRSIWASARHLAV
jgi:Ca2+-binding EF-hand superfamily protein